jgi:hypothetical protein
MSNSSLLGVKMSVITQMDRKAAREIREILTNELPDLLAPYGLKFELGGARYDDDSVKFTGFRLMVEGALSPTAKALQQELEDRANFNWSDDVGEIRYPELDADKIADYRGDKYTLIGYKPRNRKYPFIMKNLSNGKNYKFDVITAERMFAKEGA